MPSFRLLLLAILLPGALAAQQPMLSLDFETGSLSEASTTDEPETSAWTIANWPLLASVATVPPVVQETGPPIDEKQLYYNGGGRVFEVTLDESQIAYFYEGDPRPEVDAAVRDIAPDWKKVVESHGIALFRLNNASEAAAISGTSLTKALRKLLPNGWFSPGLKTAVDHETLFVPDRFLIMLEGEIAKNPRPFFAREGLSVERDDFVGMKNVYMVRPYKDRSALELLDFANELEEREGVAWTDSDFVTVGVRPSSPCSSYTPANPTTQDAWLGGGFGLNINPAWAICGGADGSGNPLVTVAIIDDGVEQTHPDIGQSPGLDYVSEDPPTGGDHFDDCEEHGTTIAGVVTMLDNAIGALGVAPKLDLISVKGHWAFVPEDESQCDFESQGSELMDAVNGAVAAGARVLNHSWNFSTFHMALETAYMNVRKNNDVIAFGSSGNNGSPSATFYPCRHAAVNCIGESNISGDRHPASNHGPHLDFLAPAFNVEVPDRTETSCNTPPCGFVVGDFVSGPTGGTSHASAAAAGVAALMIAEQPLLKPDIIEWFLVLTARDRAPAGWDNQHGHGIIHAGNAMSLANRYLFADRYEDGDFLRWSAVSP